MTDNELLLAISDMMDAKLKHITKDVQEMKKDIKDVKIRTDNLENEIKSIHLILENEVKPPLDNIQACYTSTFDRYKDSVEDYKDMKQDISLMKKVIQEHSIKLQNIS